MLRSVLRAAAAAVFVVMAGPVRAEAVDPASSPFAALGKQYIEAFDKKDAAAAAALFAEDAIRVNAGGILRGRAAIQKAIETALESGVHDLKLQYHVAHVDGNTGCAVLESNSQVRGKDGALNTPAHGFTS